MNLTVTGKNIQITEGLRSYVEKKLDRVKYYFPHLIDVHVVMEVEKKINHKIEITIKSDVKVFHSEFKSEDMYAAIDGLIDRVERQIRRYKEKLHDFNADRVSVALEEKTSGKTDFAFTKVREIMPRPMSDEEAILQLEASDYQFHIYKKSPKMTEEDFARLMEKEMEYHKSVVIKDNGKFVILYKNNGTWEESQVEMKNDTLKVLNTKKGVQVEEQSVDEAVKALIDKNEPYHIFYDRDLKSLTIVYRRKNKTLGLIIGNNQQLAS